MTEYTPGTEEVRDAWVGAFRCGHVSEEAEYSTGPFDYPEVFGMFDRWLSELIRKEREEAWDEGFDAHDEDWEHHEASGWGDEDCLDATYNPYRKEQP